MTNTTDDVQNPKDVTGKKSFRIKPRSTHYTTDIEKPGELFAAGLPQQAEIPLKIRQQQADSSRDL